MRDISRTENLTRDDQGQRYVEFIRWIEQSLKRLESRFESRISVVPLKMKRFIKSGSVVNAGSKINDKVNQVETVQCHECFYALFLYDSDKKKGIFVRMKRWLGSGNLQHCAKKTFKSRPAPGNDLNHIPVHDIECKTILAFRKEFLKRLTVINRLSVFENQFSDILHNEKLANSSQKATKK